MSFRKSLSRIVLGSGLVASMLLTPVAPAASRLLDGGGIGNGDPSATHTLPQASTDVSTDGGGIGNGDPSAERGTWLAGGGIGNGDPSGG